MNTKIICFEGIMGAGKTTQIRKTQSMLFQKKNRCIVFSEENQLEPFKGVIAKWKSDGCPKFNANLVKEFARARFEVQKKHLFPLFNRSGWLLLDRSVFTGAVYQAGELSPEKIIRINIKEGVFLPDKGAVLLCSPETALIRCNLRDKKHSLAAHSLYENLSDITTRLNIYKDLLIKYSYLNEINSESSEDEVFRQILKVLNI